MIPGFIDGIAGAIVNYFIRLKQAGKAQLSEIESLRSQIERLKAQLPREVHDITKVIQRELIKDTNRDLKIELRAKNLVNAGGEALAISMTNDDFIVIDAFPYSAGVAYSIANKTDETRTTAGQLGYIKDMTGTGVGMSRAFQFMSDVGKERLEELSSIEDEELIDLLRREN